MNSEISPDVIPDQIPQGSISEPDLPEYEPPQGVPLLDARDAARIIVSAMRPFCAERDGKPLIQIAGSIRRAKLFVKDIEIVACPHWTEEPDPADLLQERIIRKNRLHREWAVRRNSVLPDQTPIQWIKPGTADIVPWQVQETGKYWRGYIDSLKAFGERCGHDKELPDRACKIDMFLTDRLNFGMILVIRTGSAEFGVEVMTHALRVGYQVRQGQLWRVRGVPEPRPIATPTEADVFRTLNLRWTLPANRRTADDVRAGWNEHQYQKYLAERRSGRSTSR